MTKPSLSKEALPRKQVEDYSILESEDEKNRERECYDSCSHFDSLNRCCWQAGKWGLCFHVDEGDYCHLGYMEEV